MAEKMAKSRGGRRAGAGRPAKHQGDLVVNLTVSMPMELATWVQNQAAEASRKLDRHISRSCFVTLCCDETAAAGRRRFPKLDGSTVNFSVSMPSKLAAWATGLAEELTTEENSVSRAQVISSCCEIYHQAGRWPDLSRL